MSVPTSQEPHDLPENLCVGLEGTNPQHRGLWWEQQASGPFRLTSLKAHRCTYRVDAVAALGQSFCY